LPLFQCGFVGFATRHRRRAHVECNSRSPLLLTNRLILPPIRNYFDDVSPPFAAPANSDTSTIITLNSKKHIAHHLSVAELNKEKGGRRNRRPHMSFTDERLTCRVFLCRRQCCHGHHHFGRQNQHYHCHYHLIHLLAYCLRYWFGFISDTRQCHSALSVQSVFII
jgi:hypothetical protein